MHVAINALSARASAGMTYLSSLLPALAAAESGHRYTVIFSSDQLELRASIPHEFETHTIRRPALGLFQRVLWEQLRLPAVLAKIHADVLFSPGNVTSLLVRCPVVLVCQNANSFSSLRIPWSLKFRMKNYMNRYLGRWSASKAAKVVFVSETSRRLMLPGLAIPREKTGVVYHGAPAVAPRSAEPIAFQVDGRFVLTVAVVHPHKNLITLVRAFRGVVAAGYEGRLFIAGDILSEGYARDLREEVNACGLGKRVSLLGRVSYPDVLKLYSCADALVMPSIEETFGLPCLEAMAAGTPVVASDYLGSVTRSDLFLPFREVCGDAAEYFDPLDDRDMCATILRALKPGRAAELRNAGFERAQNYKWSDAAATLVQLFEAAAGSAVSASTRLDGPGKG